MYTVCILNYYHFSPGMTLVASLKTTRAVLKDRKSSETGAATSPSCKPSTALLFRTYTISVWSSIFTCNKQLLQNWAYLICMYKL